MKRARFLNFKNKKISSKNKKDSHWAYVQGKPIFFSPDKTTALLNKYKRPVAFYWDNKILYTENDGKLYNIFNDLVYNDFTVKNNARLLKPKNNQDRDHLELQIKKRNIPWDKIKETVEKGLVLPNVTPHYDNLLYCLDDIIVVVTNHKNYLEVRTAYYITDIAENGYIHFHLRRLVRKLEKTSEVVKARVVDRTASENWCRHPLSNIINFIYFKCSLMDHEKRKLFLKNKTLKNLIEISEKSIDNMGIIPWDYDNGKQVFKAIKSHDYTLVLELDSNNKGDLTGQQKAILASSGLSVDKYPNFRMELIENHKNKIAVMFDLRYWHPQEHSWSII